MKFPPVSTYPASPTVIVQFSGLMVIRCLNPQNCEIDVLRSATHKLQIGLEVKEPGNATRTIPIKLAGGGRAFQMIQTPPSSGVAAYNRSGAAFSRSPSDDGRDFRWSINLEGDEFHREELEVIPEQIHTTILLTSGIFCAASRTDEVSFPYITRTRGGQYGIRSLADVVAARIDLPAQSRLDLSGLTGAVISLPRPADRPGTTYVITITNEPPGAPMAANNELADYYPALRKQGGAPITDGEKWKLEVVPPDVSTDEIPCMPGIFDGRF